MQKILIAIDSYKLGLFEERLTEAGYKYEVGDGFTFDTKHIYVWVTNPQAIAPLIEKANTDARKLPGRN